LATNLPKAIFTEAVYFETLARTSQLLDAMARISGVGQGEIGKAQAMAKGKRQ